MGRKESNKKKIGNFRESFIFANSVKRHICDAQSSQLRNNLHISVSERESDFAISCGFYMRSFAKLKP